MGYIKVNHQDFEKTAQVIDRYVENHKSNMRKMDNEVKALSACWSGTDYSQFYKEWNYINATDSTSGKMIRALENYAQFLRFCGNTYKSAQSRAINRANSLPK